MTEWQVVADAAEASRRLREKIQHDTRVENQVSTLRVNHEAKIVFQAELDAEDTPVLEMTTLANFVNDPSTAPVDLIEGVVKDNSLCLMLGPSGSGKSTLGLQMLHSLMTGTDWLGQTTKPLSGSVGVVSYDMDAAMVLDWMSGYPNVDHNKVSVVNAHKRGNPLGVPAMRAQMADTWKAMGVEVVVIDSFSASFFGHDQNDAAATMAHYRDLKLFALTEVGARLLVVIVHSTEASPSRARGSSVHHDVADTIVGVVSSPTGQRRVSMVKYRAARGQQQMDDVMIGAPDDVTHLVEIDPGAMTMNGMTLPASAAASAFTDLDTHEEPVPDDGSDETDSEEEEMDL